MNEALTEYQQIVEHPEPAGGSSYTLHGRPYIHSNRCALCSEFGGYADTKRCIDCEANVNAETALPHTRIATVIAREQALRKAATDYHSATLRDNAKRDTRQAQQAWDAALDAGIALREVLRAPLDDGPLREALKAARAAERERCARVTCRMCAGECEAVYVEGQGWRHPMRYHGATQPVLEPCRASAIRRLTDEE